MGLLDPEPGKGRKISFSYLGTVIEASADAQTGAD